MRTLGRLALAALAVLAVSALAVAGERSVVQGKVTAVSDKAVILADGNGALWTFQVTEGARVYARGATHKSQMLVSSGKPTTMDDFVREGHQVTVYFREQDGVRYITRLRVL
jgi:predicted lipoprotein with Yx(FWY)xxD motif